MDQSLNHVALLVASLEKSINFLSPFGFQMGEIDVFQSEGTREVYVESNFGNSLLLIEAFKKGPYKNALEKRGPGFHHLALDVLNLDQFVDSLIGTGWFLHPFSFKSRKNFNTIFIARPGFPGLIEVRECNQILSKENFVNEVALNFGSPIEKMLGAIGLEKILRPTNENETISLGVHRLELKKITH